MTKPMTNAGTAGLGSLAGRELAEVERALAELRAGRPVRLEPEAGPALLVLPAEGVEPAALAALGTAETGVRRPGLLLVVTATRARFLGLAGAGGEAAAIDASGLGAAEIAVLADPTRPQQRPVDALPPALVPPPGGSAALELLKAARLLPAALVVPAGETRPAATVDEAAVRRFREEAVAQLVRVAESAVPLLDAEDTRIVAFRPADGGREHLAIVVGRPEPGRPALVRLHSECFTGDLLRSLRCDCGDQLRGAIETMSREGAGVLLYLAQEGRGIGLVNKLRAYALQDRGADTLDANEQLGFDADERVYRPAAEMLRQLGLTKVRLLTNNPLKVEALVHCGVEVVERVPHAFPSNGHNEAYLDTKARRFGHLL